MDSQEVGIPTNVAESGRKRNTKAAEVSLQSILPKIFPLIPSLIPYYAMSTHGVFSKSVRKLAEITYKVLHISPLAS